MGHWKTVPFGRLGDGGKASFALGPFGSKVTTKDYVTSGVPFIRGVNLGDGRFRDAEFVYIGEGVAEEVASASVGPGDLVFTRKGTIGQVSMIPRKSRFPLYVISSSQMKARLDGEKAVSEFYYYWFRSPQGQRALLANASQVGVPSIANSLATLREIQVPCPPLAEQQAIVEVLGALDGKIALNGQLALTALDLAGSLYERESVESDDWAEVALSETAKWLSGGTPKTSEPSYWGGDIPWISAASLKTPWLYESERRVTSLGARNGTRLVPKGTVLFVVRGMSLTSEFRVGVAQREVAFGQDCKALIPHPDIDPTTLFLAIKAQTANILGMVDLAGHGTGRLVTERVANLRVRLPQGRSATEFAARVGALLDRAVAATHENRTLADLRDTLLPQLISGKLRVRDAVRTVEEVV